MTVTITKGDGNVDKFSLTCSNCNDTSRREAAPNSINTRYNNLVPYTTYSFKATAIAGTESNNRKGSDIVPVDCKTNDGREYLFLGFIVINVFHVFVSRDIVCAYAIYNPTSVGIDC